MLRALRLYDDETEPLQEGRLNSVKGSVQHVMLGKRFCNAPQCVALPRNNSACIVELNAGCAPCSLENAVFLCTLPLALFAVPVATFLYFERLGYTIIESRRGT